MKNEQDTQERQVSWTQRFLSKFAQPLINLMDKWGAESSEKMRKRSLEELNELIASGSGMITLIAAQELVRRSEIARGFNPDAQ